MTWSLELFESNQIYKAHSGILHKYDSKNEIRETTAFEHYMALLDSLGLVTKINTFVRCTKFGILYLELIKNSRYEDEELGSIVTNLFFQYWILNYDADALILLLQEINGDFKSSDLDNLLYSEKDLREKIDILLQNRIKIKAEFANSIVRAALEIRFVANTKHEFRHKSSSKNIFTTSKHSVPPRLNWLEDWNFIQQCDGKYKLTNKGNIFYTAIPRLPSFDGVKDISENWLNNSFFYLMPLLNNQNYQAFDKIIEQKQNSILANLLSNAFEWQKDGALRLSYYPTFLYICFKTIIEHNIITTFEILNQKLKQPFLVNNKSYTLHLATRLNESYISITIN